MDAIREVSSFLSSWNKNVLDDLVKRIKKVKKELESCRNGGISEYRVRKETMLRFKLEMLEDQVNVYWRQ
uniref:Uncharacterized protein n=1 Tax=Arundo donax TaxID=35708 RepID=A0A0A9CDU6_ARUDO